MSEKLQIFPTVEWFGPRRVSAKTLKHVLLSCNISISSFLLAIIGSFGNLAKRSNAEDAAEKKKKQGQDKRPRQQQQTL